LATLLLFFSFFVHSCFYNFGVRLQNVLGLLGFVNLVVVATSGILVHFGVIGLKNGKDIPKGNFERFWEGTRWEANPLVSALYSIIWYAFYSQFLSTKITNGRDASCRSFTGYINANYVLSEMRDPIRTMKKAAPIAISAITVTYLLVNLAYFIVVDKAEILMSGQAVT
jgi:amino acid transporter